MESQAEQMQLISHTDYRTNFIFHFLTQTELDVLGWL